MIKRGGHLLPSNGEPVSMGEIIMQKIIKFVAWLPVYTAIIVTLTLVLVLFGIPFIGGGR